MRKVIGVASCPAGIAHTYMAAEMLEKVGKKMGYTVKIETNGASGVENRLTKEDIQEAVAVIIAADVTVEMARFKGKPLIEVSVSDAIKKASKIFTKIDNAELETY